MKYWTTLQKLMWLKRVSGGSQEYEGDIVEFVTNSSKQLKNLIISMSPIQEGTGDPSPDNVRPITGRTGASAWRTWKNLLSNGTINKAGNTYHIGGSSGSEYPFFLKAGTYTASNAGTASYMYWQLKGTSINNPIHNGTTTVGTFTLAEDGWYRFWFYSIDADASFTDIQIELGSTATDYEPYQGNLFSVDWTDEAGTVYSGTVDIVTGEMRVRPEYPSYNGETLLGEWMSSMDKYVAGTTPTAGAQVVDLGGTETTYHLTPQEIMSLVGQNVVWSPDGSVKVRV